MSNLAGTVAQGITIGEYNSLGGIAMAGSLGMSTGPLVGGLIFDLFDSYRWLYIGAWAMGLGAVLIALTFRPLPKVMPAAATA